jgi:hypothetical protein
MFLDCNKTDFYTGKLFAIVADIVFLLILMFLTPIDLILMGGQQQGINNV